MSNFLITGIRSIDFFGVKPKLTIGKSTKYKTLLGGFISILVFILISAGFIHFGLELVNRLNPTVITTSLYQQSPDEYALKLQNFGFFVGFQDSNSNYYIDPTILGLTIIYSVYENVMVNGTINLISSVQNLAVQPCDLNTNFPDFKDQFSNQPLHSLYCVDPASFQNISLGGAWGQNTFSLIELKAQICQNSTDSNIICQSTAAIDTALSGGFFVLNFVDTLFQPENYTDPNTFFRRDTYTTMSNLYYKEVNFYFKNVEYNTDQGILLENISTKHYLKMDYNRELYDFRSRESGVILNCVLRMSNQKDIYNRKYIKIQDVLAQVGGLVKALIVLVQIIYSNFSKVGYYFHLWEYLFEVNSSDEVEKNEVGQSSLFVYKSQVNSSISLPMVNLNNKIKISKSLVAKKFDKKQTSFTECIKLGACFCFFSTKGKNRKRAFNKLCNYIDVKSDFKSVLLSQEKLEIMKEILLTKEQASIFDYYTDKIDLDRCDPDDRQDEKNIIKSYELLSLIRQNKVGDRLKSMFEKKLL